MESLLTLQPRKLINDNKKYEVGSLFRCEKQDHKQQTKELIYAIPDEFDLFADKKKKRLGLVNLLNTDKYIEKDSFRYNLKW